MTTYKYSGVSPDGVKVSGVVQAYDEYEAVAHLRDTCAVITKIEPVKEKSGGPKFGTLRIPEKELAILCSQFSIILTSGMAVDRCVKMVAAQARTKDLRQMLEKVAEDVSGGYSLAQSFKNNCPTLPATFVETVRAGEQAGTLELCFDRLHTYYDKSAKTRAKVISTLTYPAMVLVVAVIVFLIIMLVAVPMFISTFEELGTELPLITRAMIALTNFLTSYWWALIGAVLLFFLVRVLLRRTEKGRLQQAEGKIFRSPLRRIHLFSSASQFSATMATMLTAGLPIVRALEVTSDVVSNYAVARAIRTVRQGVEQGRSLADCMGESNCFPRMLSEMTGVGERSGNLEQTLTVVGEYFDNEVSVMTERLLSLLEPAITIGLAILTVGLLLAVYLPLFTMYASV